MTPTSPRHRLPTSSVDRTIAHVPIVARLKPPMSRNAEYVHKFVAKAVRRVDKAMARQVRESIFFRPRDESASVASMSPPIRQPKKNAEAGKPVMMDPAHCKAHSDMVEVRSGKSQAQESLGSWQMSETESHDSLPSRVLQCHIGWASVKTEMNVCWASKNHAKETRMAWRNWAHPNSPMKFSMVESRDGRGFSRRGASEELSELGWERRGLVESAIWEKRIFYAWSGEIACYLL